MGGVTSFVSPLAVSATEAALDRIERLDATIGAFTDVRADDALRAARDLDEGTRRQGLLHGVPIGVKELFDVAAADNSYGSEVRAGLRARSDASAVRALRRAGAIIVGLTRSHEYGWGITTQHVTRGSTRNPWNLDRVPGGSSGGSAAAVAAGLVPLAIGTDTGGSIRIPAAFCGVIGLKTTIGRVSRAGVVPLAPSFDTVGILARQVSLIAAALGSICARDARDPSTLGAPRLGRSVTRSNLGGVRFAIADELCPLPVSPHRSAALGEVADAFVALGARQGAAVVPNGTASYEIFVPNQLAEAFDVHHALLGTYPDRAASYGQDVRARLEMASRVTLAEYLAARRDADAITSGFGRAFASTDVLVSLVGCAGPSSTDDPDNVLCDGRSMPSRDAIMPTTVGQNLAGLPSVTFPCGADEDGMPIGVQVTGPRWSEVMLLSIVRLLENEGVLTVRVAPGFA